MGILALKARAVRPTFLPVALLIGALVAVGCGTQEEEPEPIEVSLTRNADGEVVFAWDGGPVNALAIMGPSSWFAENEPLQPPRIYSPVVWGTVVPDTNMALTNKVPEPPVESVEYRLTLQELTGCSTTLEEECTTVRYVDHYFVPSDLPVE